jgi:hypothetical protein
MATKRPNKHNILLLMMMLVDVVVMIDPSTEAHVEERAEEA